MKTTRKNPLPCNFLFNKIATISENTITIGIFIISCTEDHNAGTKSISFVSALLKFASPANSNPKLLRSVIFEKANTTEYSNGYKKNRENPNNQGRIHRYPALPSRFFNFV